MLQGGPPLAWLSLEPACVLLFQRLNRAAAQVVARFRACAGPRPRFHQHACSSAWRLSGARCGMEDLNRASCQSRISGTSCNTGRFDERAANDARCDCGSRIAGHMKCPVRPQAACSGDASQRKSRFVHEVGIARAVRHSRNDSRVRHLGRRRQRPQAPRSGGATS